MRAPRRAPTPRCRAPAASAAASARPPCPARPFHGEIVMTRLLAAALLASTLISAPALAEDPRLVERLYSEDEVVRIEGRANVQATIRFAADEHIENVAIGDSNAWQVTPNRRANLLFIKPLSERP